jgi:hypothetical protein
MAKPVAAFCSGVAGDSGYAVRLVKEGTVRTLCCSHVSRVPLTNCVGSARRSCDCELGA